MLQLLLACSVEAEQGVPLLVQVRGSIPLFWHQEGGGSRLKPDILLQQYDPLYSATRTHIDDLRSRYGAFSASFRAWLIPCRRLGTLVAGLFLLGSLWLVLNSTGGSSDALCDACTGNPVVCLNLVKASEKRPRETLLRTEFQNAIQYLNQRVRRASDPAQVATSHDRFLIAMASLYYFFLLCVFAMQVMFSVDC